MTTLLIAIGILAGVTFLFGGKSNFTWKKFSVLIAISLILSAIFIANKQEKVLPEAKHTKEYIQETLGAFPGDYSLYQEVTIDNTKVNADLTDFPVYLDLSDLDVTGTDMWDTVRSDCGDIRVTKSDGTTELAREIVSCDTTAKTGEMHVKYTGTLASTTDTVIRVWYNGSDAEPASDSTYGSEAVWGSEYKFVSHDGGLTDSTSNAVSLTNFGTDVITGKIGTGREWIPANKDYIKGTHSYTNTTYSNFTYSMWYRPDGGTVTIFGDAGTGNFTMHPFYTNNTVYMDFGDTNVRLTVTNAGYSGVLAKYDFRVKSGTGNAIFRNGSSVASTASTNSVTLNNSMRYDFGINGTSGHFDGIVDEMRVIGDALSDEWISTEYNNQNSPSTFYSVGTEQTSGGVTTSYTTGISGIDFY